MKKILLPFFILIVSYNVSAVERSLSLSLVSNFVDRGVTQTDDKAAVQANYELSQAKDSGFYAGFFTSNVSRGALVSVFGGMKFSFGNKVILDIGAAEYIYSDNKPTFSHEFYIGIEKDLSYAKYYFGENEARYLDLGTGFVIYSETELLFHFGQTSSSGQDGNDISVTLQKDFGSTTLGATLTHEDTTAAKDSKAFAYISIDF